MRQFRLVPIVCVAFAMLGCVTPLETLDEICRQDVYVVNTTDEGSVDPADADELCSIGGTCTLRSAIITANVCSTATPKTVSLQDAATYELNHPDPLSGTHRARSRHYLAQIGENILLPVIWGDVIIEGNGASIARGPEFPRWGRMFAVVDRGRLELGNITLSGANVNLRSGEAGTAQGAVVYNEGVTKLDHVTITSSGGGSTSGTSQRSASLVFNGACEAIPPTQDRPICQGGGALEIRDSTFSGDDLVVSEGMIVNRRPSWIDEVTVPGAPTVSATISGETVFSGFERVAVVNSANLEVNAATFRDLTEADSTGMGACVLKNTGGATLDGINVAGCTRTAAIMNRGNLTLRNSELKENQPELNGLIAHFGGSIVIQNSEIIENDNPSSASGMLWCVGRGDFEIDNVTFRDNTVTIPSGAGAITIGEPCSGSMRGAVFQNNAPKNCNLWAGAISVDLGGNSSTDDSCGF
ncbi:MAG TPA: hypothetical protein VKA94_02610 [Hyphomicrobiales bacterium]|nr:hypothetical protein [Hyphomicrobiales bacterium]